MRYLAINSSFIIAAFIHKKKLQQKLYMESENIKNLKEERERERERENENLLKNNSNSKFFEKMNPLDKKISRISKEEELLNYKKRISEYRQSVIFEDLSDLFNFNSKNYNENLKKFLLQENKNDKNFLEEAILAGDKDDVPNRGFIQLDIGKQRRMMKSNNGKDPLEGKTEDEILLDNPIDHFQKILLFKIGNNYHATGSFCSYCLTNLKEGILLGDKLICPNCISEYYVVEGTVESGPAVKDLANFPVLLRENKIFIRVPLEKIPPFSEPLFAEGNNELDPRHIVLIGDTDTIAGTINTLRLFYTGKISVITNKGDNNFVDRNKLTKSLFPIKAKHAKFMDHNEINKMGINVYEEKVNYIDNIKRIISLKNKMVIPYDKILIATGSNREKLAFKYDNVFYLENIKDHSDIHNAIIKPKVKSIVVYGNNMKSIEIASSIRRYLDAIGKEEINISIISEKKNIVEEYCGKESFKIIQDYLKRNRIFIFRGEEIELEKEVINNDNNINDNLPFEEIQNDIKNEGRNTRWELSEAKTLDKANIKNIIISGAKYVFKLPVDVIIYENGLADSKCDFASKILLVNDMNKFPVLDYPNIFLPDDRMSINESKRYPFIFTSGNNAYITAPGLYSAKLRSDNMRINYQLGYFSAISMFEYHYPFDDVVVDNCKILDKNLFYIGTEPYLPAKNIIKYVNPEKGQFVVYSYEDENKLLGCFVYGFKNLHLFIREAMRYKITPDLSYALNNKDDLHRKITEGVLKSTDEIKCLRNFILKNVNQINTTRYTVEDQKYSEDLMKRGLMAYQEMTKKYREEDLKFQEEYEKHKKLQGEINDRHAADVKRKEKKN
jgi:nitrite reductase/ring-hydroxylating ferredoxin subunit